VSHTIWITVLGALAVWVVVVVLHAMVGAKNPATEPLEAQAPTHHHDHGHDHAEDHRHTGGGPGKAHH
jgi:hypothetical protein